MFVLFLSSTITLGLSTSDKIYYRIAFRNENVVQWFLENGADPNGIYHGCRTALTTAASRGSIAEVKRTVAGGGVFATDTDIIAHVGHMSASQCSKLTVSLLIGCSSSCRCRSKSN